MRLAGEVGDLGGSVTTLSRRGGPHRAEGRQVLVGAGHGAAPAALVERACFEERRAAGGVAARTGGADSLGGLERGIHRTSSDLGFQPDQELLKRQGLETLREGLKALLGVDRGLAVRRAGDDPSEHRRDLAVALGTRARDALYRGQRRAIPVIPALDVLAPRARGVLASAERL